MDAYLDIETSFDGDITIIGIHTSRDGTVQILEPSYDDLRIYKILESISVIFSYNGNSFDIPVIRKKIGINILENIRSVDLKNVCWKKNIYGGLKKVEKYFGIERMTCDVDGRAAMMLWKSYKNENDADALEKLLRYNKEDVENLIQLRKKLENIF
ncbi:MAG: ribonuclease H-like domain-containing protein [Candidatus Schekmanbacteria bacterium]|nr:ribonuclease H-like domain-containing protein [Candidatus Schekmanbacteria bacterium]